MISDSLEFETDSHLSGLCSICSKRTFFRHVPGRVFRESFVCVSCSSTGRYRALAHGVLSYLSRLSGVSLGVIADLRETGLTQIKVLDTQPPFSYPPHAGYQLPSALRETGKAEVTCTSYEPSFAWGIRLSEGVQNENLECLTFPDDSFDIVVTSDVMEHVRLIERAHSEIRRVLKPGGCYVFTAPNTRAVFETLQRVVVIDENDPAQDVMKLPPEYHASATAGEGPVLSYRVFGTEIDAELQSLGFSVEYRVPRDPEFGLIDSEYFYCVLSNSAGMGV
jgi:O-antigen biosynthesis protein